MITRFEDIGAKDPEDNGAAVISLLPPLAHFKNARMKMHVRVGFPLRFCSMLVGLVLVSTLSAGSSAQDADIASATSGDSSEKIVFLHLRISGGATTLVDSSIQQGRLKSLHTSGAGAIGTLSYELRSAANEVVATGSLPNPSLLRLETGAPASQGGKLRSTASQADNGDVYTRVPYYPAAKRLHLFKKTAAASGGMTRLAASQISLGSVELPSTPTVAPAPMLATAAAPILRTLFRNGPLSNRINLAILAEGYTTSQEAKFYADAAVLASKLFAAEPFKEYRPYFNAFAVFVASAQSGSDHPSSSIYRNTYFNSSFNSYGIDRLLTLPPNNYDSNSAHGEGKVQQVLSSVLPSYDIAVVLVNDPQYGGSGGTIAVASTNSESGEVVIHELGHTIGKLGDEYDDAFPGYPDTEEPNTTKTTTRASVKWHAWFRSSTPVPTPGLSFYGNVIGLFQGAHYHSVGWYRSKLNCKMRTLGTGFCTVCSEALIEAFSKNITFANAITPAAGAHTLGPLESAVFSVTPIRPATHSLSISWRLDNALLSPSGTSTRTDYRTIAASKLLPGAHKLMVIVRDATEKVRVDPSNQTIQSNTWMLNIAATGENAPNPAAAISPADNATSVVARPLFKASPFTDPDTSSTHFASRWIISRRSDGVVINSGEDHLHLTSYPLAIALAHSTAYTWQVQYEDNSGRWSTFCAPTRFTTAAQ